MGTHNVFDNNQCPCGSINDPIVDKLLGNAYQVVKYVAMNMPAIKVVSDEIASILAVYAKLKELSDIQAKIPELMEVQAALPHLEVLHTNLVQLLTLYTHIDELVKVATGIDDIHVITPHLQELATVAANITEVVATGTNITKVIAVANSITSVNKLAPVVAEIDTLAQNVQALVNINTHLPELLNIDHHLPDLLNIETPLSKLVINSFEALRRTYAEAGLILVTGSFEDGAKITAKQDVVLERKTGKVYNWQGNIPADGKVILSGSTPESSGGVGDGKWSDVSNNTLLNNLIVPGYSAPYFIASSVSDNIGNAFFGIKANAVSSYPDYKGIPQYNPTLTIETKKLQDMLDWASESRKTPTLSGNIAVDDTVIMRTFASLNCTGVIVPVTHEWNPAASSVLSIDQKWFVTDSPSFNADQSNYLNTQHSTITGVLKINPLGFNSIPATGIVGVSGFGICMDDVRIWGCRKGGISLLSGPEWKIKAGMVCAPIDSEFGAKGIYINTSDCQIGNFVPQFYTKGVVLDSQATNNSLSKVHAWGWNDKVYQPKLGKMLIPFEVHGGYNKFTDCFSDTPMRNDATAVPSYANGGIGVYNTGYGNTFVNHNVKGYEAAKTVMFWLNNAIDTSLLNCGWTTFESIESMGQVRFEGTSDITNTTIQGGNIGKYWLWDNDRTLSQNAGTFTTSRMKFQIDRSFVVGSFTADGVVSNNASSDQFAFTLPSILSNCQGASPVNNWYPFRNVLTSVPDVVSIMAIFSSGKLRFQYHTKSGGSDFVKLNQLATGGLTLSVDFTLVMPNR